MLTILAALLRIDKGRLERVAVSPKGDGRRQGRQSSVIAIALAGGRYLIKFLPKF
ncbi:MAG: hypothetical protein RLZZ568_1427 [Cyanobacteriota bacterium]